MASKQKFYTVSTRLFTSLKEAEEQLQDWNEREGLQQGSKVFEVVAAYEPKLKLVKTNKIFVKKLNKLKKGKNGKKVS